MAQRLMTYADLFGSRLAGWEDAQDTTATPSDASTGKVAAIQSKAATPYTLSQSNTSAQAVAVPNGMNGQRWLQFSGGQYYFGLANAMPQGSDLLTMITVCVSNGTDPQKFRDYGGGGGQQRTNGSRNGYPDVGINGADHTLSGSAPQYLGTPRIAVQQTGLFSGTNQSIQWIDGSSTSYSQALNFNSSGQGVMLGGFASFIGTTDPGSVLEPLNGYIGDTVAVIGAITSDERAKAEGIAAWRWGLQGNLPANHAYKNAAPMVDTGGTTVTPDPAAQQQSATSPTLAARSSIQPDSAREQQAATSAALAAKSSVAPDSASQAQTATTPSLGGKVSANPDPASQSQAATSPVLNGKITAYPDAASHPQTAAQPSITPRAITAPDNAAEAHTAGSPTISVKTTALPSAGMQIQVATSPTLAVKATAIVASATQTQALASPFVFFGTRPTPPAVRTVISTYSPRLATSLAPSRIAA